MALIDSSSSTSPQPEGTSPEVQTPPIAQQPSPIALTSIPERPSLRLAVPTVFSIDLPSAEFLC
jgi:hypothetical protein